MRGFVTLEAVLDLYFTSNIPGSENVENNVMNRNSPTFISSG